uniref:Protein kinase domain-containing protein n=1 Tax=Globodera rostochiensis TaxID=31243 RepID=A0A914HMA6_GLORO
MTDINTLRLLFFLFLYLKLASGGAFYENEDGNKNKKSSTIKVEELSDEFILHQISTPQKKFPPPVQKATRRCQCGRTELAQMSPMELTNLEDGKRISLLCDNENKLGSGTYSKVLHAELTKGNNYKKCVALKMTRRKIMKNSDWQKHKKEWKIQKAFDKLPEKERKHVIKLLAYGYYKKMKKNKEKEYVFSILELGCHDLIGHMKRRRVEWFSNNIQVDDRAIETDIRQLAETVRDMHQLIMHLDLKPYNLVYVREGKNQLMKAIDFGASQFINEEARDQQGHEVQQANACKWFVVNDPLTTKLYQSPEHYNQCNWNYDAQKEHSMELSSKSDIWAFGIITFEMALIGSEFKWTFDEKSQKDANDIEAQVQNAINDLWKLYIENKDIEQLEKDWRFPRLFHLITAVLVYESDERPTANGILDFLDGKCRFESMLNKPSRLFPWLSMAQFKAHLENKNNLLKKEFKGSKGSNKKLLKEVAEVEQLLRMANVEEWKPSDAQRNVPCDTMTNRPKSTVAMPAMAENAIQRTYFGLKNDNNKKWLTNLEKTIGLSLSPSITSITVKHKGLFENLQDSFYNRDLEFPGAMGNRFVDLLSTIGYGNLLKQLDIVNERYKSDAQMLKKVVESVRKRLGAEWEKIYALALQYECDEEESLYVDIIEQTSALYLYELVYKQLLDQFNANDFLRKESSQEKFLSKWLESILANLKSYHTEKEKGILMSIRYQKEQFETKERVSSIEMEETVKMIRDEYNQQFLELKDIEYQTIRLAAAIGNVSDFRQMKEWINSLKKQENDLLFVKKTTQEMLKDVKNQLTFLDEELKEKMLRIQLTNEKDLEAIRQGLELCKLVENKIVEFQKILPIIHFCCEKIKGIFEKLLTQKFECAENNWIISTSHHRCPGQTCAMTDGLNEGERGELLRSQLDPCRCVAGRTFRCRLLDGAEEEASSLTTSPPLLPITTASAHSSFFSSDDISHSDQQDRPVRSAPLTAKKMGELPTGALTTAAILAITSFGAILIGVPLMLNDVANLQSELAQKSQVYMDMSNNMWRDIMTQGEQSRKEHANIRQRRQYGGVGPAVASSPVGSATASATCPQGPKGSPGYPGEPGQDGQPGLPGGVGVAGGGAAAFGSQQGGQCAPCPGGPPGPPGYKGKRGPRGEKGAKGSPGLPGREGQPGEEGPEGEIGLQGEIGEAGPRGPPGEQGIGYAKGEPGPKGEAGPHGEAGEEGPPGERGEDSPPGPPGEHGPQGPPGLQGKAGEQGPPGAAGPPGAPAEYCPCPERSNGQPGAIGPHAVAGPQGVASGPAGGGASSSPAAPPHVAGGGPAAAQQYNKYAHAAALRTRHRVA